MGSLNNVSSYVDSQISSTIVRDGVSNIEVKAKNAVNSLIINSSSPSTNNPTGWVDFLSDGINFYKNEGSGDNLAWYLRPKEIIIPGTVTASIIDSRFSIRDNSSIYIPFLNMLVINLRIYATSAISEPRVTPLEFKIDNKNFAFTNTYRALTCYGSSAYDSYLDICLSSFLSNNTLIIDKPANVGSYNFPVMISGVSLGLYF